MNSIILLAGVIATVGMIALTIARWRGRLAVGCQIAFLIRFQLVLILSPILIVLLSYGVPGIFGNLIILGDDGSAFREGLFVSLAGFGSAWFCLALVIIVLDHAVARFRVPAFVVPRWFWNWSAALFLVPPLILMVRVYLASPQTFWGIVTGFGAALVFAMLIDLLVHILDPVNAPLHRRFIFSSGNRLYPTRLRNWFNRHDPLRHVPARLFGWLDYLGPGYSRNGRPTPDLIAAVLMLLAALVLYTVTFRRGGANIADTGNPGVPTLGYLEVLSFAFGLVLAGAAYYLDRYRVPVLGAVAIYTLLCSRVADTDHYWYASMPDPVTSAFGQNVRYTDGVEGFLDGDFVRAGADEVLREDGKPILVVVAASGGGIEAAAWTARVRTGLQQELGDRGAAFARSIRLISSTSGGSLGSLYFVQSMFAAGDAPSPAQLTEIWNASTRGSLNATGWGFVYPDFARLFARWALPLWLRGIPRDYGGPASSGHRYEEVDRGWALEQAWRVALDPAEPAKYIKSNLSEWREAVNQGRLPGTVFNATLVETGSPLLLSTIRLTKPDKYGALIFGQDGTDNGADLSTVTAARLSATFPYVSPVSRGRSNQALAGCCQPADGYHVADGGYYDNFGLVVALEWINEVVGKYRVPVWRLPCHTAGCSNKIAKIILIRINAFPDSSLPNPHGGWTSEILGPVKTVLNARTAA
jgi:hypothetical protein